MRSEVKAWEAARTGMNGGVNWQFTTEDAQVKLNILFPKFIDMLLLATPLFCDRIFPVRQ
jgi:hypothetical protein